MFVRKQGRQLSPVSLRYLVLHPLAKFACMDNEPDELGYILLLFLLAGFWAWGF